MKLTNRIAIVGHAADKFTPMTEGVARATIEEIFLARPVEQNILISGGCHLGGIDIFAEDCAKGLGIECEIYLPVRHTWSGGYKERNLQIAESCDEAWCIVVNDYPPDYALPKFGNGKCYHCRDARPPHVKSGGCWTLKQAARLDKPTHWVIIDAHSLEATLV